MDRFVNAKLATLIMAPNNVRVKIIIKIIFLECDISCVTCIDSSTKCKSCDISITFRMDLSNINQCPCRQGFYDDGTNICKSILFIFYLECSYKFLNCVGSKENCTFCFVNPGDFRDNISP